MLAVDPPADVSSSSLFLLSPPHVFEIVTAESTFFCGIDLNDVTVKDVQVIAAGTIVDHSEWNDPFVTTIYVHSLMKVAVTSELL